MFMTEQKKEGKKILGIQRNIFFVGITSFLTDTTTKMIYSIMPLFLMSLGASKTEVSLIEGMAESTASILKALSGWWSDKIGRNKPLMIIGYGFTALLSPIFAFAASPLQVLIIRVTERIGKGIRTAPRDSLVAGSSEDNTKGRNFGFHKAMDNSGAILGPLIAFGILMFFPKDYRMVLLIAGIPGLFGLITIIGFVKEAKRKKQDLLGKISVKDFSKQFYFLLIIVFIFTLGNSTDALLLIKAGDVGISNEFIPMMYLIFNSVSVLLAVPAGVFSDKIGRERLIIFGYVIYALIYFGFGRTSSPVIVILLFAFYGVYSALTDGVQKALVSDLIDKNKRGTGLGIYNCLVGMTLLPASVIAGLLYDHINNRAPFYFGAILAVIAALLMLIFFNTNKKKLISNDN
jgi:MFS family permease